MYGVPETAVAVTPSVQTFNLPPGFSALVTVETRTDPSDDWGASWRIYGVGVEAQEHAAFPARAQ
jgi:hypothetical protein